MSSAPTASRRFGSLKRRFLLIVLFGAIAPLAVTGWWLTRSAVRSAELLLRTQLDTSLTTIAVSADRRWAERRADLLFLAENEVSARTVASAVRAATAADSEFMARLFTEVRPAIPRVALVTTTGSVRWAFGGDEPGTIGLPVGAASERPPASLAGDPRIATELPVRDASGRDVGLLRAEVLVRAVLPGDSIPVLVRGAQLAVIDQRTGQTLSSDGPAALPRNRSSFVVGSVPWIGATRALAGPSLDLVLAAPAGRYTEPFRDAAGFGLLMLVLVALTTIVLSVYFTTRVTRSLERLADAADGVAAGDFGHDVESGDTDEVARLARSFDAMLQSLRRTLQELAHQQALAAVGEFAASLSHEVRNGLTSVRLNLQRVKEYMPPDDTAGEALGRALESVQRLDTAVTGSLAVARGGKVAMSIVDLRTVLARAVAGAEGAYATARARLDLNVGDGARYEVRGDPDALEHLMLNLLINAAQALSPGGHATVEVCEDDQAVTVSVRDSGAGMAQDQLARSGEPFYSSKPGGTGLGLSIARRIAEAHGAELKIDSESGVGTIVRVRLPRRS